MKVKLYFTGAMMAAEPSEADKPEEDHTFNLWMRIAIALFFAGLGAWFVGDQWEEVRSGAVSQNWPSTEGKLLSGTIKTEEKSGRRGRKYLLHSPQIQYEYSLEGKAYRGTRLSFSPVTSRERNEMVRVLSDLQVAQPLLVYYNPADSGESVLRPGVTWDRYAFLIFLIGFMVAGPLYAFWTWRKHSQARAAANDAQWA